MRTEIIFEKFEKPTFVGNDGTMTWCKNGVIHRGKYRPAILSEKYHEAIFYVNGKVIRNANIRTYEEQITEIMDEFDFDRVHQVMTFLKWEWYSENFAVPTIDNIKEVALQKLRNVAMDFGNSDEQYECWINSGGLKASCNEYGMNLEFILEDWNTKL